MGEMHENRHAYVARVKELAQEDLEKNGLELESVAIIDIDQTALEYFNPLEPLRRRGHDRADQGHRVAAQAQETTSSRTR